MPDRPFDITPFLSQDEGQHFDERTAIGDALAVLGETTFDIYPNARAHWRNVPAAVWT